MDSQELKVATLNFLLFRRNFLGAFTESFNQADVLGISPKHLSQEFEIKVSKEDLAKETKAIEFLTGKDTNMRRARGANKLLKHATYLKNEKYGYHSKYFIPNYFSFVVPNEVVAFAKRAVEGTPYGVYRVEHQTLYSEKTPTLLHNNPMGTDQLLTLLRKASTENVSLRERLLTIDKVV